MRIKVKRIKSKPLGLFSSGSEICLRCGCNRIRFSASIPLHVRRFFQGSRRRYCIACGNKWSAKMIQNGSRRREKKRLIIWIAFAILFMASLWTFFGNKTATEVAEEDEPIVITRASEE